MDRVTDSAGKETSTLIRLRCRHLTDRKLQGGNRPWSAFACLLEFPSVYLGGFLVCVRHHTGHTPYSPKRFLSFVTLRIHRDKIIWYRAFRTLWNIVRGAADESVLGEYSTIFSVADDALFGGRRRHGSQLAGRVSHINRQSRSVTLFLSLFLSFFLPSFLPFFLSIFLSLALDDPSSQTHA